MKPVGLVLKANYKGRRLTKLAEEQKVESKAGRRTKGGKEVKEERRKRNKESWQRNRR